jgi:hypothetical protein
MRQRSWIPAWRVALASLCLTAVVQPLGAQPLSPEEQLQAIRHSLVQLALDGPTEVRNTAWLDDQGRLQDSSSFRSGMTLRSVRVAAYGRGADEQPTAQLGISREAGQFAVAERRSCAKGMEQGQPWHQMHLEVSVSPQIPLAHRQQAHQAARHVRSLMLEQGRRSPVWRLQELSLPASAYERALSLQGEQHVPWRLQLMVTPVSQPRELPAQVALHWRAVHRLDPAQSFDYEVIVTLEERPTSTHPDRLSSLVLLALQEATDVFLAGTEQRLACVPPQFQVLTREGAAKYRIAAGQTSGLKVGDRLVMVDPNTMPTRVLEPQVLDRLALAQVDSLGPYYAELKQVAGPALPGGTSWVAVPVNP